MAFVFDSLHIGLQLRLGVFTLQIWRVLSSVKLEWRSLGFHFLVVNLIFSWLFISSHSTSFAHAQESETETERVSLAAAADAAGIDIEGSCGNAFGSGWTEYKDEKCLKIIGVGTQGEGQLTCLPETQTLAESILQASGGEEREFVSGLIVEANREKYENLSIWLAQSTRVDRTLQRTPGAGKETKTADKLGKNEGGTAAESTTEQPEEDYHKKRKREAPSPVCMQIESPSGEQKKASCYNPNVVVCQKPVRWTYSHWNSLQKSIITSLYLAMNAKKSSDALNKNLGNLRESQEQKAVEADEKAQKCSDELDALRDQLASLKDGIVKIKETHRNITRIKNDLNDKYSQLEEKFKNAATYLVGIKDKVNETIKGNGKPKPTEKPKTTKKPAKSKKKPTTTTTE